MREFSPAPVDIPSRDGGTLRVWDYGGVGQPLLFCHCAGTMGRIWEPVLARFAGGRRLLALDFRGHGDSLKPESRGHYQWASYAGDVEDAVRGMGIGGCAGAAGHSGGGTAVAMAQLANPGFFQKIALVDAILAPANFFTERMPLAEGARRRRIHFHSLEGAVERLGAKYPYDAWHPEAREAYWRHGFEVGDDGTATLKCPGRLEAFFYECGSSESTLTRLGEITVPVLCVTGQQSYMEGHVRAQHGLLRQGRLEVLAGTGHFVPQERPEETAERLSEWFGE
ncbi:MAG: alpha/beta hydrolase [Candidatus Hydrogenedentes bacterium]|nr:alpha/beta hydrolase [Candidatus Hydrogenedentota bacterium]